MTSTAPTVPTGEEGMVENPVLTAGQVLGAVAAFAAGLGAVFGLFVLVVLACGLSVFAVWLSMDTRRQVLNRAERVADDAVKITIDHGGNPFPEASDD